MQNPIEELIFRIKQKGIVHGKSTEQLIHAFEMENKIYLPADFKTFISEVNAVNENLQFEMVNFWTLDRMVPIFQYFDASVKLTTDLKDAINNGLRYDSSTNSEEQFFRSGTFAIKNSHSYFLFADYNMNASYWAIQLTTSMKKNNQIISINDWGNQYRVVAKSFTEFATQFVRFSPEALL
jgi:hypothetical protein